MSIYLDDTISESSLIVVGDAPIPFTISPNFNSSDADVVLTSTDNVQFLVHKNNLAASSVIFNDMFQLSLKSTTRENIRLDESSGVLEAILPYVYPRYIPPIELDSSPHYFAVIAAMDKYSIWRGLDCFSRAFQLASEIIPRSSTPIEIAVHSFLFAALINEPATKKRSLIKIQELCPDPQILSAIIKQVGLHLPNRDDGKELDHAYMKLCYNIYSEHIKIGCRLWELWTGPALLSDNSVVSVSSSCTPVQLCDGWIRAGKLRSISQIEAEIRESEVKLKCHHCKHHAIIFLSNFRDEVGILQRLFLSL